MTPDSSIIARSEAILKSWKTLDWPSVFSAIIYPALGVLALLTALIAGFALESVSLHWWYAPLAIAATAFAIFICNMGIGPLHRIWQHRAGQLTAPAQVMVVINCVIAMQGRVKDWVNYHTQHHHWSDRAGDPHNPHESKLWAWVGWLLWRDEADLDRPMARWLQRHKAVMFHDRHFIWLYLGIHLMLPLLAYGITFALGGPVVLIAILHACLVIGRGIQFHATTLGVNVFGHLKTPRWVDYLLALLTGGEALHGHHHDFPRSALHLPKRGIWNRIVDYNGTALLVLNRLKLVKDLKIAPQFLPAPVTVRN
ncbi:acyl-CoA desaturase [Hyphobacterium sp.]|jgi:stearoyl-CoA desaturase (delta-9 desaturase)|uniref:acyl-CoA desaturase n=1 Tax=Hyphobacterium sp. TaxID=2004662 RepID=UPI003BABA52D